MFQNSLWIWRCLRISIQHFLQFVHNYTKMKPISIKILEMWKILKNWIKHILLANSKTNLTFKVLDQDFLNISWFVAVGSTLTVQKVSFGPCGRKRWKVGPPVSIRNIRHFTLSNHTQFTIILDFFQILLQKLLQIYIYWKRKVCIKIKNTP